MDPVRPSRSGCNRQPEVSTSARSSLNNDDKCYYDKNNEFSNVTARYVTGTSPRNLHLRELVQCLSICYALHFHTNIDPRPIPFGRSGLPCTTWLSLALNNTTNIDPLRQAPGTTTFGPRTQIITTITDETSLYKVITALSQ